LISGSFGVTKVTLPLKHAKYFQKYFKKPPQKKPPGTIRTGKQPPGLRLWPKSRGTVRKIIKFAL
jgi:hypothetical protein